MVKSPLLEVIIGIQQTYISKMSVVMLVALGLVYSVQSQTLECVPNEADHDALTQFIYTYGTFHRFTEEETVAVGFTVFNRVADPDFPNSTAEVINWQWNQRGKNKKCYGKLTKQNFLSRWNRAKEDNTVEYQAFLQTSRDILCGGADDSTEGATDFSRQPTPRLFHAPRWLRAADSGRQIGDLYFFKLAPQTARRRGGGGTGGNERRRGQGRGDRRGPGRGQGQSDGRRVRIR